MSVKRKLLQNAGQKGAVTIATNMAGRGTDIKLGEGVREVGGLHVLVQSVMRVVGLIISCVVVLVVKGIQVHLSFIYRWKMN